MGRSVTIALPPKWTLASIARTLSALEIPLDVKVFEEQLDIYRSQAAWAVVEAIPDGEPGSDYNDKWDYMSDPHVDEQFRRDLGSLHLFSIRFNDIETARRILYLIMSNVVDDGDIAWIDTEYEWVVSAKDFITRTDRKPDWDWKDRDS
jgi:hypothetical protein